MQGRDDELEQRALEEKLAQLREKQDAAAKQGNSQAAADYNQAIALQQQIAAEKAQQKREQAAKAAAEQIAQAEKANQTHQAEISRAISQAAAEPVAVNVDIGSLKDALGSLKTQTAQQAVDLLIKQMQQEMSVQR